MASSVATVAGGLLGLAGIGAVAACWAVAARRERPYLPGSVAVGLDVARDPLAVALHHGYAGIQLCVSSADDGALHLAGGDAQPRGPLLERGLLQPLAARVKPTAHGRVYAAQGEPFLVLLELASAADGDLAYPALDALLRQHASMLSRFAGGRLTRAAVTVVLTGPGWPRQAVAGEYERYVFLEGDLGDLESPAAPPSLVPLVGERLAERVGWDPRERWAELPAEARHILRATVAAVHHDGRQIRFVDLPERPKRDRTMFWREALAADVDYVGSTNIAGLARFLRKTGAHRRPTHARVEPSRRAAQGFAR
jgi:hypothetical protein